MTNKDSMSVEEFDEACEDLENRLVEEYELTRLVARIAIYRLVSGLSLQEISDVTGIAVTSLISVLKTVKETIKKKGFHELDK